MQKAAQKEVRKKVIPDKLFYKIGEISKIADVEPYVLRYWESEFPFLKPRKSKSGQRIYVRKDLEVVIQIKEMLYRDRYTIEGVRKRLSEGIGHKISHVSEKDNTSENTLGFVKKRLREILNQIK